MTIELQGKRALIVDDDPIYTALTVELLSEHGVECDTASDGEQGSHLAKTKPYDFILMDVKLPLIDGLTATRALRDSLNLATFTRIIAFTSLDLAMVYEDIQEAGFSGFVQKPFQADTLLAALTA